MSGHSKWATIKHKKAATDAKRGKIFTKIIRELTIAARTGGGDPVTNPRLRTAICLAKNENMPNDNIERAIQRGTGQLEGETLDEVMFEGYGPGGVGVLVQVVTSNRNRIVSEIRHMFSKNGGNMAENGAVGWMFHRKGDIVVPKEAGRRRQDDGHRAGCRRGRFARRRFGLGSDDAAGSDGKGARSAGGRRDYAGVGGSGVSCRRIT